MSSVPPQNLKIHAGKPDVPASGVCPHAWGAAPLRASLLQDKWQGMAWTGQRALTQSTSEVCSLGCGISELPPDEVDSPGQSVS